MPLRSSLIAGSDSMLRRLTNRFLGGASGELFTFTARAIAITSILCAGIAYYVAEKAETEGPRIVALFGLGGEQRATVGVDMTTTGSIRAPKVTLDPCNTAANR